MIYLLCGEDAEKARGKMHALAESLRVKKPDAAFFVMDDEHFGASELEERISSAGLFEQKCIVVLDNVFRNKEAKEAVLARVKEIGASDNVFIILEGKLDKKALAKFEKCAEKVQEFVVSAGSALAAPAKKAFNIFALSDAVGRRDKKQAWVLLQEAFAEGLAPEEVHGAIFWGVKSMLIARDAKSAQEAKLNPFVFKKSQGFAKNFKGGELEEVSSRLVSLYHDARRGGTELPVALEMFTLTL